MVKFQYRVICTSKEVIKRRIIMLPIEKEVKKMLQDEHIVGAAIALTNREGLVFSRGFGLCDINYQASYVTENSLFRAASVTKIVTGTLTMKLSELGLIELDRPVIEYLPWLTMRDMDAAMRITPRMLLSHTSGLPAEYTPEGPRDEGQLVPSLMAGLPTLELASAPGDGVFLYSNWGIRLLSAALESRTGERYSALAKRYVLDPLGMTSSRFMLEDRVKYEICYPHEIDGDGALSVTHEIKENYCRLATGGLYSNAVDLSRLARMLLSGGVADDGTRVIKTESMDAMMIPVSTMKSGDGYGLTLTRHKLTESRWTYGHNGNAEPYTSSLYVDTESGYGAVVLLNTNNKVNLRQKISDAILKEFL